MKTFPWILDGKVKTFDINYVVLFQCDFNFPCIKLTLYK